MSELEIVWTKVDEAPALATFSLLPIVEAFVGVAGVRMKLKDISLTGRILANFPDKLRPDQKVGTPSASALQPLSARSSQEPGQMALAIATGIPSRRPTSVAQRPSCSVAGTRCMMRWSTGSRVCSERPRSPDSAETSHDQYWTSTGRSRPRRAVSSRTCSGVAFSPRMLATGPPGTA